MASGESHFHARGSLVERWVPRLPAGRSGSTTLASMRCRCFLDEEASPHPVDGFVQRFIRRSTAHENLELLRCIPSAVICMREPFPRYGRYGSTHFLNRLLAAHSSSPGFSERACRDGVLPGRMSIRSGALSFAFATKPPVSSPVPARPEYAVRLTSEIIRATQSIFISIPFDRCFTLPPALRRDVPKA